MQYFSLYRLKNQATLFLFSVCDFLIKFIYHTNISINHARMSFGFILLLKEYFLYHLHLFEFKINQNWHANKLIANYDDIGSIAIFGSAL